MTSPLGDQLTQVAFSLYENKGVFALLLGSGLSRTAEIPTGWEITLDLVRRVALAQGVTDQPDWAAWYCQETGQDPNYSVLLEELASSPEERRSILHSYIEPTAEDQEDGRKIPTAAHKAIADLVRGGYIRVIITTNFDRLMENALRERGIEPTVISSIDGLAGAEPITHSTCYLLKLHGDYKDARILNTEAELNGYPKQYDTQLDRILDEHGLIVCGWSGEWDHALRAAILRAPNRRYSTFWAVRGDIGSGAQELIDHRRSRVIPISSADDFFVSLHQRVETLQQSRRQNPLTIDLLVNSAKRYLVRPEFRIQLDDLFTEEADRLVTLLDTTDFALPGQWDQAVYRARVKRYETATEGLASMAGVLGRWGNDTELTLITDTIRILYSQAQEVSNGLTIFLGLRSYPAVLVFTAYALGLTRAERWHSLHKLFDSIIWRDNGKSIRAVEALFLDAWKGTENDAWKQIEGLDRHKTALSEYLLILFAEWSQRFAGLTSDFELLFERYEMLGSLSHLERHEKASLEQEMSNQQGYGTWMPIGRAGWRHTHTECIPSEFQTEAVRAHLLSAGFAKGDAEFFDLFATNFKKLAGRMRYNR